MKVYIAFMVLFAVLTGTEAGQMTEEDKAYIVNRHNELRRGVQPTASNMLKMSWSEEAAANAQRWAESTQCLMRHSPSTARRINSGTIKCGENIAMGYSHTESSWHDKIQMWYDEVNNWQYGQGGEGVLHFTQIVWYRASLIGCAVAHCPDAHFKYFYVCQYCSTQLTPAVPAHPYTAGPACGACPNNCDDGLCTNPCPYQDKFNNCNSSKAYKCRNYPDECQATCKCTSGEIN